MAKDEAYREAEKRIEVAKQDGATELDLRNLGLSELPETIGELVDLKVLDLGYKDDKEGERNKLTELPESSGNLTQLQRLDLDSNQLTTVPEFLGNFTQLHWLYLDSNQLTTVPESLGNLTQLQGLSLSSNQLTTVPEFLGNLTQLQGLSLSSNQLTTVPEFLGNLTQLKILALSSNQLTTVPEFLGNFTQLHWLYLYSNQLTDIPISLAQLKHLKTLTLNNNPLNPELAAANEQGLDAIKAYLQAKAEGEVVLNEAKLIIVGEGDVGKSCLLGALRGDPWLKDCPTTHGIEIKPVTLTDTTNNTEIILNGWDFGGQRVYRPTHQLFFSAPAVYLVVWKPREGPQQGFVREWITLIKHREPDAKVIVVATHGGPQQRQPDIDRQELTDLFGEDTVQGFFFVDSKPHEATTECKNVSSLKEKITEVATALPGMGRTIPAKWHQVREALKATGKPYLSYQDVLAICAAQGVTGFLAEQCIRVYHTLGNIVHYHYDTVLKDIVILKPDWLTKAISFVLDDEQTRHNNGLVEFAHLSQLWSNPPVAGEEGYPLDLHPVFLRLMEKFDLSYKVVLDAASTEESTTSLIAQLVPDNRPHPLPWREEEGERQQIQICRIVDKRGQLANAEGLFYRLIVRLHKYSLGRNDYRKSIHWQRGLMLDDEYNGRALLEHIGTNVQITVRAAYPRHFLHQLTQEVKWLVESWKGLKCKIFVPCIAPCGMNQPGLAKFEVKKLIVTKQRNQTEYLCNVSGCDEWQNIDKLMLNAPVIKTRENEEISEMQREIRGIRQDIRVLDQRNQKGFQGLKQGQKVILSKVDEQFTNLMQTFTDEAKEGPRLFSFKPVEPSFFDSPKWLKAKFQLTLWCEHSRQPLPTLNPGNSKQGVYEIELSREWFTKAAPYLKLMTTTIGLVLPVGASATKLLLEENVYKGIEEELDFAQKAIEFSTKSTDLVVDGLRENNAPDFEYGKDIRAEGAMLRQLHAILKEEDPSFGGLARVPNKRQEFVWVHPQFVKEY